MFQRILFLVLISVILIPSVQAQKRPLRPSDVYRISGTGSGQVSPDGSWFLYTVSVVDSAKDRRNADLWMKRWDGKDSVQLTSGPESESNPRWSPDNKYISFVATRAPATTGQIYLMNRLGGEGIRLTDIKGDLNDYAWSPDAKRLLLTIRDPEDTSGKKGPKPYVISRYQFKRDVSGYQHETRRTHLYLFDLQTKKLDTLTRGAHDEGSAQWSPDGKSIAFVSNRTADPDKNSNDDIYVIESRPGAAARALTSWKGSDGSLQWSPDSRFIAYTRSTSDEDYIMYDQSVLAILPASGGEPKLLSLALDRPVSTPRWSADGSSILALVSDDAQRYIASFDPTTGKMSRVAGGDRVFVSLERHPRGGWLTSMTDPALPAEYYALENGGLRRLTYVQDSTFSQVSLAKVRKIVSRSKDGTQVTNLLYLPESQAAGKLPTIFFIHGGPVAQDEFSFDLSRQMLAARGYAVVAVNYRGSNGRGLAFCKAIYADWGNLEVMDIHGAVDKLLADGIADPARLAIGGWSYGGILTNYSIATDQRFKAAVSGAGSAMQLSLYGVDQYILQFDRELGQPWVNRNYEKYLKLSYPFLKADKIKTPTLFMVGEKDFNVPALGSEQMYQALRSIGTPTELVIYPGQFHAITLPSFQKDRFERYLAWYDKYLK
jgi:dipeptidyl aminopeptidase/acylaminoacyl peptidase